MRNLFASTLLILTLMVFGPQPGVSQNGQAVVAPTEISAELGTCSALFNVTGADSKPVYNAKISVRIHYGVMGLKKLDLETFTSADGQAKFVKLPEVPKKPVYFYISKDDKLETVEFMPDVHCRATFDVRLK
ncbi:MAG: hypothetical protein ABSD13_01310 [Candidatus Korobacteraceae bacterium]|jgi:hypothetical protein